MQADAERLGAGLEDGQRLRQRVGVDDEDGVGLGAAGPAHQRHRLGGGGGLVEHGGAGDVETGEVGDHRLEVDQRLEPALADLGLVGRVGGVPGRVLQHGALDDRRGDRAVVAQPDHRGVDVVGGGALAQLRPGRRPRRRRPGRSSGVRSRTPSGTQASTSDSSVGCPTTASISAVSSARGPMCRAANDPAGFSEFSDGSDPVSGGSDPPSVQRRSTRSDTAERYQRRRAARRRERPRDAVPAESDRLGSGRAPRADAHAGSARGRSGAGPGSRAGPERAQRRSGRHLAAESSGGRR